jgi:hypothetical protein
MLHIMCGLPFAGKTTAAAQLSRELVVRVVSIDEIKASLGLRDLWEEMQPSAWDEIFTRAADLVTRELRSGRSVIYDSTNHTKASRDALRELAHRAGAEARVIFVDVPVAEAEERWRLNKARRLRMDLSDWAFRKTVEDFEPPADEADVVKWPAQPR